MRMKITSTIFTLTFLLLISQINGASQVAIWPQITDVKSGDHKLLLQTLNATTYTYIQYYRVGTNFTLPPYVVLAIRDLQIDSTSEAIDFKVQVLTSNIKTTQFATTVTKTGTFTIAYMYYMYVTMSKTYKYTYYLYYSENVQSLFSNSTTGNIIKVFNNITVNESSSALVIPYFVSFGLGSNSSEYSISTSGSMVNSTSINIQINSNSSLYRIELMIIIVDRYAYTVGYVNFLDYGFIIGYNNGTSNTVNFSPPFFVYYNTMSGVTSMRIQKQYAINFYFQQSTSTFLTDTSYIYIKAQIIQWRLRSCVGSTMPFYTSQQQKCYDNCSNSVFYKYGENVTYSFCALCNSNCVTCDGNGQCKTCDATNFRELNTTTKSCVCKNGYFDNGFTMCGACDYTCLTCTSKSTTCTSCVTGRTLTNSSCPCNDLTYDNQTNSSVCVSCDYKCYTCQLISTNCTKCDNTTNRVFDSQNLKCPCATKFVQDGNATCAASPLVCTAPCITCSFVQTNCTSCNTTNRLVLSSSQCVCQTGFTLATITYCTQICGDGKILSSDNQCDDGNTLNGDGCSSTCQVQSGFTCSNNSTRSPTSLCISSSSYIIATQSLVRDTSSNLVILTVTFTPTPPSSIDCSLTNYVGQLQLASYSFNPSSSTMTININILQEVTSSQALVVSFPLIHQTTNAALQVTNNLQLKPYSSFQISFYQIQLYLVWFYVGFLWIGAVVFIAFINPSSFSSIFQLFIFTSITWIGIEGQQKYSLLFVPLRNLRYIFGPNLQLNSQQTLFQVFNIGCIMFALPLIGFGIILLLNKRKTVIISTKIKRFVLFDLTYGWLIINGFLIVYGLGIITKITTLRAIDYGGLIFGIAYILACLGASYKLFFGQKQLEINPKLQIMKKNIYRPRVYSAVIVSYLIISLVFISISKLVKINSIMMIGFTLLIFVLFALGNILINKIKYMINLVILFFIFGCIFLYNSVNSATWCGLAITALLYIQLAINLSFLVFERNNNKLGEESQLQSQMPQIQNQETVKKLPQNTDRDQQFEEEPSLQNKSNLEGYFQNHFNIYEPTVKKPVLEIGIAPPEMLYDTSAIIRTPKQTSNRYRDNRLAKQKSMLNQQFLQETQLKQQLNYQQRQQIDNDLIEIGNREVPMDAI